MFKSRCQTRAIDETNVEGAKSTRDLTPSPLHHTGNEAYDQDSSIRSTLRVEDSDSLWMLSIINNFSELKQSDVRSKYSHLSIVKLLFSRKKAS